MMMTTRKAIFQNAALEKSDNCEYEGGGELSWGIERERGVSTITIDRPVKIRSWKVHSAKEHDCFVNQ